MSGGNTNNKQQFACLYTKHKTQKRKVWHDGRLVLTAGNRAVLHDANPKLGSSDPSLDQCEISPSQRQGLLQSCNGQMIEMEKFLVEVDAPWTAAAAANAVVPLVQTRASSSSLQKILTSKFQKPKVYIPPHPSSQPSRVEAVLGKRRRPLQPGEILHMHYGGQPPNDVMMTGQVSMNERQPVFPKRMPSENPAMGPHPQSGMLGGAPPQNLHQGKNGPPPNSQNCQGVQEDQTLISFQAPLGRPQSLGMATNLVQRQTATQRPGQPRSFHVPGEQQPRQHNTSQIASDNNIDRFSNNGFCADEFYGLEEEHEEEEEPHKLPELPSHHPETSGSPPPRQNHSSSGSMPSNRLPEQLRSSPMNNPLAAPQKFNLGDASDSDSDNDDGGGGPSSFRWKNDAPTVRAAVPSAPSKPISGNDMLALFGMAAEKGDDETVSQGTRGESLCESSNMPSNHDRADENANTSNGDSMHHINQRQKDMAGQQQQKSTHFYLAPPDTSSDESSDGEDN
jgi:hypothetical protein